MSKGKIISVHVPDIIHDRLRYLYDYLKSLLPNLFSFTRFIKRRCRFRLETRVVLQPRKVACWNKLFGVRRQRTYPFTYFTNTKAFIFNYYLQKLKISLRNIVHLKNEVCFEDLHYDIDKRACYKQATRFLTAIKISDSRVALKFVSNLYKPNGDLLKTAYDYMLVLGLSSDHMESLETMLIQDSKEGEDLKRISRRRPRLKRENGVISRTLYISKNIPMRYAHVSGDYNPVHTLPLVHWLFGIKRPFIQGLCTSNYLIKYLVDVFDGRLAGYDIVFSNPVEVDQHITIYLYDKQFEIVNERGVLVCFGTYKLQSRH